ncbi:hypothetical protein SKAU_G00304210 [Synaphobranchus kaupii]|uniref:Uncharacterized protein n=1 Tax=Synaphobranchus kaupii TaxID=118154 RepID=A0A9Q1INK3_SYNKA|nr:hypothetical protein SKAU_G00304210 [Synaphobranchus kaupii]
MTTHPTPNSPHFKPGTNPSSSDTLIKPRRAVSGFKRAVGRASLPSLLLPRAVSIVPLAPRALWLHVVAINNGTFLPAKRWAAASHADKEAGDGGRETSPRYRSGCRSRNQAAIRTAG